MTGDGLLERNTAEHRRLGGRLTMTTQRRVWAAIGLAFLAFAAAVFWLLPWVLSRSEAAEAPGLLRVTQGLVYLSGGPAQA